MRSDCHSRRMPSRSSARPHRTWYRLALALLLVLELACQPSDQDAESAPPTSIRLTTLLTKATLQSPMYGVVSPDLERFRTLYTPADLAPEGAPPWLLKQVPLLVGKQRRIDERLALFLPPPSRLEMPLNLAGAWRLRLHLGMIDALGEFDRPEYTGLTFAELIEPKPLDTDGVRFVVAFRPEDQEAQVLLERFHDPVSTPAHQRWVEIEVDLSDFADVPGHLILETHGSKDADGPQNTDSDFAFIADPTLLPTTLPEDADRPLNVLLIGVDTLRADRLGAYGYGRPTSPRLDALAREGVLFERAIAPAPWTLPSFTSLLTSLYPSRHGAGSGGRGGYAHVHPDAVLLSEILYAENYTTAGVVANPFVSSQYGLDQGYGMYNYPNFYHPIFRNTSQAMREGAFESADEDAPRVIEFLEGQGQRPFFLFWHILDPHLPYQVSEERQQQFTDPAYEGEYHGFVDFRALVNRPGRRLHAHEGAPPPPPMSPEDRRHISDLYDAEVAETDAAIGRVLETLDSLGLRENTLVVVTSDHGEGLGDHGHYHHGYTLYEDQIRVPLILRHPEGPAGKVVQRPVSTVDVGPMILGALGIPIPEDMQGLDRLAAGGSGSPPVFSEAPTYDSSAQKTVYLGQQKYLHDPNFATEQVFDLAEDPAELDDRFAENSDFVARARPVLDRFREHNLRGGRYHLLLSAKEGQRVAAHLLAGEVFDANAMLLVDGEVAPFELDLNRKHLRFETVAGTQYLELIFWFRGDALEISIEIGGNPLPMDAIRSSQGSPLSLDAEGRILTGQIPVARSPELSPADATALLWFEDTGLRPLETQSSPEDLERLRALGYVQ